MADNPQKQPDEAVTDKTRIVEATTGDIDDIPVTPKDRLIGRTIAENYLIEEPIGQGGMSLVYKAEHQLLDTTFAIKFISTKLLYDEKSILRFQNEAKAACQLNHANICTVREFGILDGERPFMVMDLLEGESLRELLDKENKLPIDRALDIILRICDGLAYAHKSGVIHRDLKPHNIMLCHDETAEETIRIVDFGIAKIIREDQEGPNLTQTGEVFGTPNYMSPEQCQGKSVTARTDIYSIGCVLYEMLSGTMPFAGNSSIETLMNQVNKTAEPINGLPKKLNTIIEKCLAKDPEDRYDTVDALMDDIKAFQKGEQIKARPVSKKSSIPMIAGLVIVTLLAMMGMKVLSQQDTSHRSESISQTKTGDLEDSINSIKKAIKAEESGKRDPAILGALYEDLAWYAFSSKEYDEALQAYKIAARHAKESDDIKKYEGRLKRICNLFDDKLLTNGKEHLESAELWCESVKQRLGSNYPEMMPPLTSKGMALSSSGQIAKADDCFRQVIEISAKYPGEQLDSLARAHWLLGLNLKEAGDADAAKNQLRNAMEFAKRAWPGGKQAEKIKAELESI